MDLNEIKNRVKFSRKKKCDVCKEIKLVTHECESCYSKGFDETYINFRKEGREDLMKEVLELIEENRFKKHAFKKRECLQSNSIIRNCTSCNFHFELKRLISEGERND